MYSTPKSVLATGLQIRLTCADSVLRLVAAGVPAGLLASALDSTMFDRSVSVQKCRYAAYQSHCFASRVCPSDPTMPSEKNPFEYRPIALPALTVNRTSSLPTVGTTPATLSAPPHDWSVKVGDLESARTCRSRPDTAIRPFEVS